MKTKMPFLGLLLVGLLTVSGCAKEGASPSPTEKAPQVSTPTGSGYLAVKQALAIAQKSVPSDAYPYIIKEGSAVLWSAKSDGTSKNWEITFYAPSQGKRYELYVKEGKAQSTWTGAGPSPAPNRLPDGWMDSTEAANTAVVKSKCAGAPSDSYFFGLYASYGAENVGKARWAIGCGESRNQIQFSIDANTGTYLGK